MIAKIQELEEKGCVLSGCQYLMFLGQPFSYVR
jgi:hypothetical protein